MVCPPFRGICCLLFPIVVFLVSLCWFLPLSPMGPLLGFLCWMVCPPLRRLVFPFCCSLSPPHVCLCWMVCQPSRDLVYPSTLVSPCLPTCVTACFGWYVSLPEVLSPLVRFPEVLSTLVSHCFRIRVPVFDGASAFPTSCLPFLSPIVIPHIYACNDLSAWRRFRLPEVLSFLVAPCFCWFPIVSPQYMFVLDGHYLPTCVSVFDGASALVCPPSRGLVSSCLPVLDGVTTFARSCFPLFPISLLVSWMVCPPSRRLISPCFPLFPFMWACVGWFVGFPKVLSPFVFHFFPLST